MCVSSLRISIKAILRASFGIRGEVFLFVSRLPSGEQRVRRFDSSYGVLAVVEAR